jgi:hypothetical protein
VLEPPATGTRLVESRTVDAIEPPEEDVEFDERGSD